MPATGGPARRLGAIDDLTEANIGGPAFLPFRRVVPMPGFSFTGQVATEPYVV
jgi:hypothetical protein